MLELVAGRPYAIWPAGRPLRLVRWVGPWVELASLAMEYKHIPPPDNASSLSPSEARALFRRNGYYGPTSGFCAGYCQANLLVVPEQLADDFEQFCRLNPAPFPLLYRSKAGECSAPPLAEDSDVK